MFKLEFNALYEDFDKKKVNQITTQAVHEIHSFIDILFNFV